MKYLNTNHWKTYAAFCLFFSSSAATGHAQEPQNSRLDAFWEAETEEQYRSAIAAILSTNPPFQEVYRELKQGRRYSAEVPTGVLQRVHEIDGVRHPYTIIVPSNYDPAKRFPVRFDLHGGMGAPEWKKNDGSWNPGWHALENTFVVLPAGWWDSMWWEYSQVKNFEAILAELRQTWNTDENRVALVGTSDGGAALFFQAMRTPDRWCSYAGAVAPPDRLRRADFRPDGQMHLSNLSGQKFLLGYGDRDKKVPLRYIRKYMELFLAAGADLKWFFNKGQGHDMKLSEAQLQEWGTFIYGHTRDPLPDRLSWSTEAPDRYGRRSWLRIDQLGEEADVEEAQVLPRLGTRLQLQGPSTPLVPFGKVNLVRQGNTVTATTSNVARFTLLISPEEFDMDEPIRVVANGNVIFDEKVPMSVETLLRWAVQDGDRTKLFAAEVKIDCTNLGEREDPKSRTEP